MILFNPYTNISKTKNTTQQTKPQHKRTPDAPPGAAISGGACTARTPIPIISDGHQISQATPLQHQLQLSKLGQGPNMNGRGRNIPPKVGLHHLLAGL